MFVNLWGRPRGHPLTYAAVYDLVRRLRRRTGIDFDPHWLRHTAATRMLRDGIGIEVVAGCSVTRTSTTTASIYGHLTVEDARRGDGTGGLVHRRAGGAVTAPARGRARQGLLGKLMAAVRGEFRSDDIGIRRRGPGVRHRPLPGGRMRTARPRAGAVSGGIGCGGSTRAARTWRSSPRRPIRGGSGSSPTNAAASRLRLRGCPPRTVRAARPALATRRAARPRRWLADPPAVKRPRNRGDLPDPALRACGRRRRGRSAGPTTTWKVNGRPDIDEFAAAVRPGRVARRRVIRLDLLAPQLKLEMQYVLQRRHDERRGKLAPHVVNRVVRLLASGPVTSLLDNDEDTWRDRGRRSQRQLSRVACSATPTGASPTWPRPAAGKPNTRAMSGGCAASASTATAPCGSTGFPSRGCGNWPNGGCGGGCRPGWAWKPAEADRSLRSPASPGSSPTSASSSIDQIDRPVLERYLADLSERPASPSVAAAHIGLLNASSPRSANTVGTQPFPPTRCSSPRTTRNARNGCRGRWPSTSWPSSSTRTTSPGSPTPPTG